MSSRFVTLPNQRRCTLGRYVAAWRALRAMNPAAPAAGFDDVPLPALEILRQLRRGMHERINRHLPAYGRGRKWTYDWQGNAMFTARLVNTPRLCIDWVPPDFRQRLQHRLRAR